MDKLNSILNKDIKPIAMKTSCNNAKMPEAANCQSNLIQI